MLGNIKYQVDEGFYVSWHHFLVIFCQKNDQMTQNNALYSNKQNVPFQPFLQNHFLMLHNVTYWSDCHPGGLDSLDSDSVSNGEIAISVSHHIISNWLAYLFAAVDVTFTLQPRSVILCKLYKLTSVEMVFGGTSSNMSIPETDWEKTFQMSASSVDVRRQEAVPGDWVSWMGPDRCVVTGPQHIHH